MPSNISNPIPLLPSMLTITLSRFQTSIVFFLNNSHQFTRFILFSCFSLLFYLASFVYISPFRISILSVEGCRLTVESSCYFLNILASERFLPFNISNPVLTLWRMTFLLLTKGTSRLNPMLPYEDDSEDDIVLVERLDPILRGDDDT